MSCFLLKMEVFVEFLGRKGTPVCFVNTRLLRLQFLTRTHISLSSQMNSFSKIKLWYLIFLNSTQKTLTNNKAIKMYNLVIRSSTTPTNYLCIFVTKKLIT